MALFVLSITGPVIAGQNLMRLFYTPAERATIDAQRPGVKQSGPVNTTVKPQTQSIQYQGYVKRKGHADVVWINNKNTLKTKKPLSDVRLIKVQNDGKATLVIKDKGRVKLKPGQVVTRGQRGVRDEYQNSK